jgi:hypothetical protein
MGLLQGGQDIENQKSKKLLALADKQLKVPNIFPS